MWDEKKFFEDYVNESEKIKPDDRFVEQLKDMAVREEKKTRILTIKYVAVAASFVLCLGLGGVAWNSLNAGSAKDDSVKSEYTVNSESASESDMVFDTELEAGQENKNHSEVMESETEGQDSIQDETAGNESIGIQETLDSIRQGAAVKDEDGNEVPQNLQEELWNLLSSADETEEPHGVERSISYFIEGEQTIEVEVYEEGFIYINGKWYQ